MRKLIILIIILLFSANFLFSERYEPAIGKSGSVIDSGNIRFLFGWAYNDLTVENSKFNFGIDFGLGQTTELQNRIDYNSANWASYEWGEWTELLKFRLSEIDAGPAYSLGLGIRIPVRKAESLGLIAGLYISSAIKDIDFDFNIGFNPYITYGDQGKDPLTDETIKIRPNHFVNIDLLLGYKLLPFLKVDGGFESRQLLKGSMKVGDVKTDIDGGSVWTFILGARLKPIDYPVLFDGTFSFGAGDQKEYDWQFKLGIQILPTSPDAEW
ncbi:MAG: hypothetical protein KKH98_10350 [Spirochaetes bacterium]|nr:hypothetical protein [Spirochaetota bacterium]